MADSQTFEVGEILVPLNIESRNNSTSTTTNGGDDDDDCSIFTFSNNKNSDSSRTHYYDHLRMRSAAYAIYRVKLHSTM